MIGDTFDLALLGFGHVAQAFVAELDRFKDRLRHEGIIARTIAVGTRRGGIAIDPGGLELATLAARSSRPFADGVAFIGEVTTAARGAAERGRLVIVETTLLNIEDGRPAIDHVRAALMAGAHVITANKGPAAFAYRELSALAARANRAFLCEGAVMDGIPVFNLVRETLPCVQVLGFRGIVNSTTNFMLTEMERGRSFEEALADMQRQGIAEADPSLDIDGWDAAAKTSALANVWLDAGITPHDVEREGIRGMTIERLHEARETGRRLRSVASAALSDGRVIARVGMEALAERDPLAALEGMQNAIVLSTDVLGELAVSELTAGLDQTAYALVSDLVAAGRFTAARGL